MEHARNACEIEIEAKRLVVLRIKGLVDKVYATFRIQFQAIFPTDGMGD